MIMTAAVEYIQADSQPKGIPTVYFYCEPDEQSESQGLLLLKSLIKQLLLHTRITRKHIPDPIVALLDKHFQEKSIIPDFDDLADLLSQLFYVVPDANYVLDGLDQLSKKNVAKLLGLIRQLFKASSQTSQSQILLCSRTSIAAPFLDIVKSIPSIIEISTTGNVFDDIQRLTKSITDEKMTYTRELTQNPTLLTEVLQTLLSEAKGM
ncbi:MAG: hypothetical protein M1814_001370 [Vezdaea aestivalis]|nr:MAG: hypothetical protein M1814_001370 [Vezdaea aestivalis]